MVAIVDNNVAIILNDQVIRARSMAIGIACPSRVSINVVDHEISVALHFKTIWATSFVVAVGSPDWIFVAVGMIVQHQISVSLHSEVEPSIC